MKLTWIIDGCPPIFSHSISMSRNPGLEIVYLYWLALKWQILKVEGLKFSSKDRLCEKVTIYIPILYLVKSSANVLFFYLHFTRLCGSWNHQSSKKNNHFENMAASFLLRSRNLLRYFTPKSMHFQAWKKLSFTNIVL